MSATETFYDVIRRQGVTRRSFTKFCSLTAASMGLGATGAANVANALETNPRVPVIWMHGLECTCCSESFIRSAHPLVKDVVLSMISLDYDDTIMAAAGHQAEAILEETKQKYKGKYILAVEGNPPLNEGGMFCIDGGRPFVEKLKAQIAAAGLQDRIRFLGELPIEEVPLWYKRIAIYVFASRVEGFGLTMLEAMAAGNAVVATRAGAAEIVIKDGDSGVLAPTGDMEALVASIEPLMRDPERAARIGERARAVVVDRFSRDREVDEIVGVYRKLWEA